MKGICGQITNQEEDSLRNDQTTDWMYKHIFSTSLPIHIYISISYLHIYPYTYLYTYPYTYLYIYPYTYLYIYSNISRKYRKQKGRGIAMQRQRSKHRCKSRLIDIMDQQTGAAHLLIYSAVLCLPPMRPIFHTNIVQLPHPGPVRLPVRWHRVHKTDGEVSDTK